ncbi:hypothetical protein SGCOL_004127 [Colletotrichum sp. CLE4]
MANSLLALLKTTADYNFGQTKGDANLGVNSVWFSFNAGASHSSESSTLQLGSEPSQVQVAITQNDLQAITITAGVCKDKFRSDSPQEVKSLARVSQIIVIAGLGYEIKVGALTAETLETKLKQTTSAGGSISVSGIPIGLGGSGSSTTENQSHKTSWDMASRIFKVVPNLNNNDATVVGVVAEPFDIKAQSTASTRCSRMSL